MGRRSLTPKVTLRGAEFAAVVAVAAFVVIIAAGVAWAGAGDVLSELRRLSPETFLGLVALSMLNFVARGLRWHVFTRKLGLPVRARRSGLYYVAGFAMTPTPGKVGEALRLWLLERCHGCRYERTAALMVGDQLSDLTVVLLLCLIGLGGFTAYAGITIAAAVLIGGLTLLLLRPAPLLRFILLAHACLGRWPRLFARVRLLFRRVAVLMDLRVYCAALGLALIAWLAQCVALYWLLSLLGADHLTLQEATFVFAFSTLVGALFMLPGGLGGTEASMVALLLALGVANEVAVAATLVFRVTTLWFAVALGFLALPRTLRLARLGPRGGLPPVAQIM